ncbi:hypothetical protein MMOS7_05080 [Methanococcus maripaludis OS7]|uniref:CRISPR/Cas system CSM-associated protein Csm2 small subunit n=1 Tax=Methanococcus maripaludis OS7 TaxID=637915 RepID=A0A2Z5PP34_METMI|nr:hypothetical protein MMOS7_05080 [Methanococcus maripaludis OS7]
MIKICPNCLHVVDHFEKDYHKSEVKAVNVHTSNKNCSVLQTGFVKDQATCSNIQSLKMNAGKIAKQLNLSEIQKNDFFNSIIKLKRDKNHLKDYVILQSALNTVLVGG